jgi:hypothetical protein
VSQKDGSRFDALFGAARSPKTTKTTKDKPDKPDKPDLPESSSDRPSKSKDPDYQRTTLYLPKRLHRKFKAAAAEDEKEMSEIMETLIQQWLDSRKDA